MIVLDASLMIAWLLSEPALAPSPEIDALLESETFVVPAHWTAEVGNALTMNVLRGRISADRLQSILQDTSKIDLEMEFELPLHRIGPIAEFAKANRLTFYDATYVHLALERSIPLATLDHAMRAAAQRVGVSLIPS